MAYDRTSATEGGTDRSRTITRRPFLRSLVGAGAFGVPALSGRAMARPPSTVRATDAGVSIGYNNCGVASVTNASDVDSLSVYFADADGARHLRAGIDPTTGEQRQHRPVIVEYSAGSDKTNIQLTESGGSLVHIVAERGADGRVSRTNPDDRCVPGGFNNQPTASFTVETDDIAATTGSIEVDVDEPVTFRSVSEDIDSPDERLRYEWDLDGNGYVGDLDDTTTHAYDTAGRYTVWHRVTDDFGASSVASLDLVVDDGIGWRPVRKLLPGDLVAGDRFGSSVGVSDGWVVVGSAFAADGGAAYVFDDLTDPSTVTKLAPDGLAAGDSFGTSVAISGDTLVVGANRDDDRAAQSGAAYVFDLADDAATPTKLVPLDLQFGDRFGTAVGVSGGRAVVGAEFGDDGEADTGATYLYTDLDAGSRSPTKLVPGDAVKNDLFGYSAAISGETALIGSVLDDDAGTNSGAVYRYDLGQDPPTSTKLVPADLDADDMFGASVAISGSLAVVGSTGVAGRGAAYVYDLNGDPSAPVKLAPNDQGGGDQFGSSVAISDRTVVVGAPFAGTGGAAYVFDDFEDPTTMTKFAPSDLGDGDMFGTSVAVSGDTAVVGASLADAAGSLSGAAYVYRG